MKKSLISKIALALVLVSVSTQAFGLGLQQNLRNYFATHPKVKYAAGIASIFIPAIVIPSAVLYCDYKMDKIGEMASNNRFCASLFVGPLIGALCCNITNKYPAEACLAAVGLTGASVASLAAFFLISGTINK